MSHFRLAAWMIGGIFTIAIAQSSFAAEAETFRWQTNYAAAQQQRATANRPMLVFVTMDGCHFCHKMLATTYADPGIARDIGSRFVPTKIDAKQQLELIRMFGVRIFPTTFVISADNRVTDRIEGYVSPDVFRDRIAAATSGLPQR